MKQFETAAFKMVIHDNLVKELTIKKDITFEAKDITESLELSVQYLPDAKFFVLFEGEENSEVSIDARRVAASEEYAKHTAALALFSEKFHFSIISNLFLKVNRPKVPTKFFDNRNAALEWLNNMADKAKG